MSMLPLNKNPYNNIIRIITLNFHYINFYIYNTYNNYNNYNYYTCNTSISWFSCSLRFIFQQLFPTMTVYMVMMKIFCHLACLYYNHYIIYCVFLQKESHV